MRMHLNHEPFMSIKDGTKTIEVRLNDVKRSQLQIGDEIIFTDLLTHEKLTTNVIKLETFSTFKELFEKYSGKVIGSSEKKTIIELDNENTKIYSRYQERKYGALAIKIELG